MAMTEQLELPMFTVSVVYQSVGYSDDRFRCIDHLAKGYS